MACPVKAVDITASARMPGVRKSTALRAPGGDGGEQLRIDLALDPVAAGGQLGRRRVGGQRLEQRRQVETGPSAEAQGVLRAAPAQVLGGALGYRPAMVDDHDLVGELF